MMSVKFDCDLLYFLFSCSSSFSISLDVGAFVHAVVVDLLTLLCHAPLSSGVCGGPAVPGAHVWRYDED